MATPLDDVCGLCRRHAPIISSTTAQFSQEKLYSETIIDCVIELTEDGLTVIEIAPGIDLEKDVLGKADVPLLVSADLRLMSAALFRPEPMGLILSRKQSRIAPPTRQSVPSS